MPPVIGLTPYDIPVMFSLEAKSDTSEPFLALDNPEAGAATQFKASNDPNSGASSMVGSFQGATPAPWVFKSAPLDRDYYLNLSMPVQGAIYISNSQSQARSQGLESAHVRIAVKMGTTLLGGETLTVTADLANEIGPWIPFALHFRAEALALKTGETISVEITRQSSLFDFFIGTAGTRQSVVIFHTLPYDPFAGTIVLEGKKSLIVPDSDQAETARDRVARFVAAGGLDSTDSDVLVVPSEPKDDSGSAPGALAMGAFAAPLFAFGGLAGRLGGRRATLLLLCSALLMGSLAGCLGSNKPAPAATSETSGELKPSETIKPIEGNGTASGYGVLAGFVHDDLGVPIRGASVAVANTRFFTTTKQDGKFRFNDVVPGEYTLRVDPPDGRKLEYRELVVKVQAGNESFYDIPLVPPTELSSNNRTHPHNDYGEVTEAMFDTVDFIPKSTLAGSTKQDLPGNWYCDAHHDGTALAGPAGGRAAGCRAVVPIQVANKHIYPGTSIVEVKLSWQATGNAPPMLGMQITSQTNTSLLLARAPGIPFRFTMFPHEADPGHQKFTNWEFAITAPVSDTLHPSGPVSWVGGSVHVEIKMIKGVVPYEPAHRDLWEGAMEKQIFKAAAKTFSCVGCKLPNVGDASETSQYSWWPKNQLIPPGTKEITGSMTWTNPHGQATWPTSFNLWYKGANVPFSQAEQLWKKVPGTAKTNGYDFTMQVPKEDVDQFYQLTSNWRFWYGDDEAGVQGVGANSLLAYSGGNTQFMLTMVAIRDPTYVDV